MYGQPPPTERVPEDHGDTFEDWRRKPRSMSNREAVVIAWRILVTLVLLALLAAVTYHHVGGGG